jgi:hypothetical protein
MANEYSQGIVKPNGAVLFTIIVLRHGGHCLLLERAVTKRVQSRRWTGMGGRVANLAATYRAPLCS